MRNAEFGIVGGRGRPPLRQTECMSIIVGDGVLDVPCERMVRYSADNRNNGKNYEGTPQLMKG